MALLSKFTDWFRSVKQPMPPPPGAKQKIDWQQRQEDMGKFVYEADGVIYPFNDGAKKIKWTEIERIAGYKADLMTTDEIRMDIAWQGKIWTLTEDTPGWYQLLQRLADAFPSIPREWDWDIVQPPFATNYTVLYEREDRVIPNFANFYCFLKSIDPSVVVCLFGSVAYHSTNVAKLDQLLDKVGVHYQYEYYDEQKKLLLAVPQ